MDVVRISKRLRAAGTIAAVVTLITAAGIVAAPPASGAYETPPILMLPRNDYQCLDVLGFDTSDGATIGQWWCNGASNQYWTLDDGGNGEFTRWQIKSHFSGKCMDVAGASHEAGARIIQYTCHGGANQRFVLEIVDHTGVDGVMPVAKIHPLSDPGLCLDVLGATDDYGAPLGQWPCNGAWNQLFILEYPD